MAKTSSSSAAPKKGGKTSVVAFKIESELAEILNQLPNKSAFIRKAIISQLDMACPLCNGSGAIPKGLHDHFQPLINNMTQRACDECGDKSTVHVADPGELAHGDRDRLEQFFHGGPFYCQPCYQKASTCNSCGWHLSPDQLKRHQVHAHHN